MGIFDGIRVIELAGLAPVPFAAMMLADHGADVVRVVRPGGDDDPNAPLNRGRATETHDLKSADGLSAVRELVSGADVFIEGFRPGVTERLGLGPADLLELNPRLVYVRVTGWGQDGPMSQAAGHDINYLALSGVLGAIGPHRTPPHAPLNLLGDFAGGGLLAAFGVAGALYERERSGQGQVVDTAMVDGIALLATSLHGRLGRGEADVEVGANLIDGGAPFYRTYETADSRYMSVGALEPHFYAVLLAGLDLDSDDLPAQYDRERWPELAERLAARFRARTRDEWAAVFADTDACVAPVLGALEAVEHPQLRSRGTFMSHEYGAQPAPAPRFGRTPANDRRTPTTDGTSR